MLKSAIDNHVTSMPARPGMLERDSLCDSGGSVVLRIDDVDKVTKRVGVLRALSKNLLKLLGLKRSRLVQPRTRTLSRIGFKR